MAPKVEYMKMMRVVVREDFSRSRCDLLVKDLLSVVEYLGGSDEKAIQRYR
jgi:glutamate decarboxylase